MPVRAESRPASLRVPQGMPAHVECADKTETARPGTPAQTECEDVAENTQPGMPAQGGGGDGALDPLRTPPAASSPAVRKSMQGNKRANTKPELTVRRMLRKMGYGGYRLQWKKCPGRPDIAFPGRKIAILVNGCFWHRCPLCQLGKPRAHAEYWEAKFASNLARDQRNLRAAAEEGWHVITVWECQLKKKRLPQTEAYLYHTLRLYDEGPACDAAIRRINAKRKSRRCGR